MTGESEPCTGQCVPLIPGLAPGWCQPTTFSYLLHPWIHARDCPDWEPHPIDEWKLELTEIMSPTLKTYLSDEHER